MSEPCATCGTKWYEVGPNMNCEECVNGLKDGTRAVVFDVEVPAPVVAEVRRATIDLEGIRAQFEADWVLTYDNSEALLAEVARLTAERDSLRFERDGVEQNRRRDNAYLIARSEKSETDLEALRARLRGLEQQWRHDQIDWVDPRTKCAEELAALLTTPEEP